MYKCCICGTEYDNEAAAVRCVNKCGRECFASGKFVKKETKHSPDITNVEFDFEDAINDILHLDVVLLIDKMFEVGAPKPQVAALRDKVLEGWNEIDNHERANRFNRVVMAAKLYGIEIPNK